MLYKIFFKKPILVAGIIIFCLFIFDLKRRGIFFKRTELLKATSCNSVLVMLNKRIPNTWTTKCNGNNLEVQVRIDKLPEDDKKVKPYLYRELANNLIFIAKNSLNESLERVDFIGLKLLSKQLEISALTQGKDIYKFDTITHPKFIAEHLKDTVKVKETIRQK